MVRPPCKRVGSVQCVYLPNVIRPTYRWIVRQRADGRYIVRAPKKGVLLRDLDKMKDTDYNAEHLLPKHTSFKKKSDSEWATHKHMVQQKRTRAAQKQTCRRHRKTTTVWGHDSQRWWWPWNHLVCELAICGNYEPSPVLHGCLVVRNPQLMLRPTALVRCRYTSKPPFRNSDWDLL